MYSKILSISKNRDRLVDLVHCCTYLLNMGIERDRVENILAFKYEGVSVVEALSVLNIRDAWNTSYDCFNLYILKCLNDTLCRDLRVLREYVKEQTELLCLIAVQQNGLALQFVKEQTHDICLITVQQNGLALEDVEEQTSDICIIAVLQNPNAKDYVNMNMMSEIRQYIS